MRAFVRPHGNDRTPTLRFVDGIERLKNARVEAGGSMPTASARLALRMAQWQPVRHAMRDALEAQHAHGLKTKASVKRRKARAKRRRLAASTAKRWLPGAFEVCELHVHPDHQSKGLGRQLLHALVADLPHPAALLSTPDSPTKAFGLYQADGFVGAGGLHTAALTRRPCASAA